MTTRRRRFAQETTVPAEQSRAEVERTLRRYGADQFLYGWSAEGAVVGFRAHGRQIRFEVPMPSRDDREFTTYTRQLAYGLREYERSASEAERLWEQACRQRWRALALVVKAKLEAVEAGITLFEDEFGMNIVLPSGLTVGQVVRPEIERSYATGRMPASLLALPGHGGEG